MSVFRCFFKGFGGVLGGVFDQISSCALQEYRWGFERVRVFSRQFFVPYRHRRVEETGLLSAEPSL